MPLLKIFGLDESSRYSYFCLVSNIDYTKYPLPRIRHHANPVLYFPLSRLKKTDILYPPVIKKAEWKKIFSNGKPPDYLDVGTGLGKFLIETAAAEPGKNILGFEVRHNAVEWTNRVLDGEHITNAKAMWYSAVNGFEFIKKHSLEKIFYFFPDPWIKKRHHKRRAFSTELLDEFARTLKPGGALYIMTDVPELDEYHREILDEHKIFSCEYTAESGWDIAARTYQEEFCINKHIPFIRMICRKINSK